MRRRISQCSAFLVLILCVLRGITTAESVEKYALQPLQKGDTLFSGESWYLLNPKTTTSFRDQKTLPFVLTDSSADSGIVFNPSVIVARMGYAYLPESEIEGNQIICAWFGSIGGAENIFTSFSTDFGNSWSDSLQISPEEGPSHNYANIDGNDSLVYVVWVGGGDDSTYLKKASLNGLDWSSMIPVAGYLETANDFTYRPDVVSNQANVFVTFEASSGSGWNQRFKRSTDNGESWLTESVVGGVASGKGGEIAYGDGVLHVVRGSGGFTEVRYDRSTDLGVTWSDDSFISDLDGEYSQWPSVAADPYGNVYATWFDYKDSPHSETGYLFLRRSSDRGITWDSIRYLSTEPLATWSDIYADSLGVYVVWSSGACCGPKKCYFRMSLDQGATWSPERLLGDTLADIWYPEIDGSDNYLSISQRTYKSGSYIGVTHILGGWVLSGDGNGDHSITISDAVYLINYIFAGGNPPVLNVSGDYNGDSFTSISDVVAIINYIFGAK